MSEDYEPEPTAREVSDVLEDIKNTLGHPGIVITGFMVIAETDATNIKMEWGKKS